MRDRLLHLLTDCGVCITLLIVIRSVRIYLPLGGGRYILTVPVEFCGQVRIVWQVKYCVTVGSPSDLKLGGYLQAAPPPAIFLDPKFHGIKGSNSRSQFGPCK